MRNTEPERKPRLCEDWIDSYLISTERSEPHELYRRWTAISVLAAAMQRRCSLQWVGAGRFFPNMYIVLIGPPAARKGTALGQGKDILNLAGVSVQADTTTCQSLIKSVAEAGVPCQSFSGATSAHSSVTVYSAELTVFLGYGNTELLTLLTDWFDCPDKWEYKTKNSGHDVVVNLFFNLIGATTPSLMSASMPQQTIGSGLGSRICFIYQPRAAKKIANPQATPEEMAMKSVLVEDLQQIMLMKGEYKPTKDFLEKYRQWYEVDSTKDPILKDPKFETYAARRQVHLLKLSMIMSASRGDSYVLDGADFDKALRTLKEAEHFMPNALAGTGAAEDAAVKAEIFRIFDSVFIDEEGKKRWVEDREIFSACYEVATHDVIEKVLLHIHRANRLKKELIDGKIMWRAYAPEEEE